MSLQPKILLGCPISEYKDYIANDWFTYLLTLTYPELDFYFVDNSLNRKYHKKIQAMGFNVDYYAPHKMKSNIFMCACNNMIRDKVLKEGYDYLFSLEEDQFAPANIIQVLLRHKLPIVAANYQIGKGNSRRIFINKTKTTSTGFKYSYDPHPFETFKDQTGQLLNAKACGIGCTLIHRSVLEKIIFRVDGPAHADTYFYQDLEKEGIQLYIDTSIHINHYNQSWKKIAEYKPLQYLKNGNN